MKNSNSVVRFENSSTESTHDSSPRSRVKWHIAKSCTGFHVSYTCSATTPWTSSSCRLASSHFPSLINKKTKVNHGVLVLIYFGLAVVFFSWDLRELYILLVSSQHINSSWASAFIYAWEALKIKQLRWSFDR